MSRDGTCDFIEDVQDCLGKVSFTNTLIPGGISFDVVGCESAISNEDGRGWLIRTSFLRKDRASGVEGTGYGRWWHVPRYVSHAGVMKTAFAAVKLVVEHELMEAFHYGGVRVFDPHHTIEDLCAAVRERDGNRPLP